MRGDVDEARLNLGDAERILLVLGRRQQRGPLDIGGQHRVDEAFRTIGGLLRKAFDARTPGQFDRAFLGRELAGDQAEQRGLADAIAPDEPHACV
jgi:hypothetical protein